MTTNGTYSNEPRPRLCHLRRWPNFVGYGFNLHCEKSRPGQYIGKVDPNSPAESAGLREHDRIVEVNYVPIGNENHKQVVSRIKEGVTRNGTKYPEEVILLVLDPDADIYYKNKQIIVRSSDSNVEKRETEDRDATENGNQSPPLSSQSIEKTESPIPVIRETSPKTNQNESNREYKHVTDFTGPTVTHTSKTGTSPTTSRSSEQDYDHGDDNENYPQASPASSTKEKRKELTSFDNSLQKSPIKDSHTKPEDSGVSQTSPSQVTSTNGSSGTLELKMSAAEYREQLKAQHARKRDPRQEHQMSMKQKHDLIDRL